MNRLYVAAALSLLANNRDRNIPNLDPQVQVSPSDPQALWDKHLAWAKLPLQIATNRQDPEKIYWEETPILLIKIMVI